MTPDPFASCKNFQELCRHVSLAGTHLASSSQDVAEGSIFIALPPAVQDPDMSPAAGGEKYAAAAVAQGAAAIVCSPAQESSVDAAIAGTACRKFVVPSTRRALGDLARAGYGAAVGGMKIVGITGTNGKTTTSYLLEHVFTRAGYRVGVIGTVSYRWPGHDEESPLTTPGCLALHALLAKMAGAGVDLVCMEVSSHALDQERVAGIDFAAALLTNVTQDHLDYHGTMDRYFAAKARLFLPQSRGGFPLDDKVGVCNADDSYARILLNGNARFIGFGLQEHPVADSRYLSGFIASQGLQGMKLSMRFEGRSWDLRTPLIGRFNALNLLGAQAVGLGLGLSPDQCLALESFSGVPGRMQRVPNQAGVNAFVDYAHTPDALINVLRAIKESGFQRIITVFGCGGNRDASKRPLMGEAVARFSDVAVVTSDNPRFEDPERIIQDILPGLAHCAHVVVEPDRRAAIRKGMALAGPQDALLVAGKGHETYQIVQGNKLVFCDASEIEEMRI